MTTVIKTITTTVLLSALLCTTGNAEARLKYYRYNANIPMVETTLNMMVAMGVIEQIPGYLVHDGNPYSRLANAQYGRDPRAPYAVPVNTGYYNAPGYGRYRGWGLNPYASNYYPYATSYNPSVSNYYPPANNYYSSTYGYPYGYGGGYSNWNNPWGSQWLGDPGFAPQSTSPWNTAWADPWNNPQWYSPWNTTWGNPWNNAYSSYPGSPWSSLWGNRLNTPWANSWNYPGGVAGNDLWASPLSNTHANPFVNPLAGTFPGTTVPGTTVPGPTVPGTAIPGYSGNYPGSMVSPSYTPGYLPGNTPSSNYGTTGPSSFGKDNPAVGAPTGSGAPKVNSFNINNISSNGSTGPMRWSNASKRNHADAGVNRRLDGLWIGDRGEMLGIRGDNFLWYDGEDGYANGTLRSTPTMLMVTRAGTRRELSMHYRLAGNELRTVGRSGKTRTFQRKQLLQQSRLASELYASPSSYQMDSLSSFASELAPGPDGAIGSIPHPGNVSDFASGSLPTYLDQQSDGKDLKSNWGEKSPLWSPGAKSTPGPEATGTKAVREVSAYRKRTDPLADDTLSAADAGFVGPSRSPINKPPGLTAITTSKSMKAARQMQQQEPSRIVFHRHQSGTSVAQSASDQRSVMRNSLIPTPAPNPIQPNSALAPSVAPFRSNLPVATGTITPYSGMPNPLTNIWRQHSDEKVQLADASEYLYSYFKSTPYSIPRAASPAADNSNIWSSATSTTSNVESEFKAPSGRTANGSNIWKPSAAFNERQRKGNVANVYYSAANDATDVQKRANAKVKKFVWAD